MALPSLKYLTENDLKLPELLDQIDQKLVEEALDEADCNIAEAARILGISRGAIHGKIRKYGIEFIRETRKAA